MSGKVNYGVASLALFYCGRRGIEPGAGSSHTATMVADSVQNISVPIDEQ
jgi:hypothetical protein